MKIWSKLYNITVTIIHGIAIGIANLIPGVSGGTMAVVLGIYQTIIDALHAVFTWSSEKWNALRYLTILGTGAILSVIFLSKTFLWLIETRAQHLSFFFIGLIIGSIPGLWFSQDNIRVSGRNILTFLSSLLLMISITTLTPEAFALTGNPLQTHFLYL